MIRPTWLEGRLLRWIAMGGMVAPSPACKRSAEVGTVVFGGLFPPGVSG
jgi:hypothetical protein